MMMNSVLSLATTLLAILGVISVVGATASSSSSSSSGLEGVTSYLNSRAASAPQVWATASNPSAVSSTLVYQSPLNTTHTVQILSTPNGQLTSVVLSTVNPLQQPTIWGTMSLSTYVAASGTVLLATRGDTSTSVLVSTTTALFVIDVSLSTSPRVHQPSSPVLAACVAPNTGLLLVVQTTQLTWWNASMAIQAAPINVTTPLVGPATAQCGSDGVCWIGDSVATFVVLYTNSAVIQTMPMRGQWPTDPAMAPVIKPVGGRRAVMTWGVRVGLLTSQLVGNLGMDWKVTQTSNTTALGVFPMLGQKGLVVTGHNVSVTVYDLADGSTIGVVGVVVTPTGMLTAFPWRWTTIEVDTSAQPYLLLASGVNFAGSWELVNATGALVSVHPTWSVMDYNPLFVSRPGVTLPSAGAEVLWYLELSWQYSYVSSIVSPRQQRTLASVQNYNAQGSLLSTLVCGGRVIAVVALASATSASQSSPPQLIGFDLEAAPTVVTMPSSILAATMDPSTNAIYTVEYVSHRLLAIHKLPLGASEPLLVAQWNVSSPNSLQPVNSTAVFYAPHLSLMSGSFFFTTRLQGTLQSSSLAAVINVATGEVAYNRYYPQGYDVAFIDTVNAKLVVQSNFTYLTIDAAGTVTTRTISKAFSGGLLAQWNNRAIIQGYTYEVIDVTTGDVLLSRSALYPAFAANGDVLECDNPSFPTLGVVQQFTIAANGTATSVRRAVLGGVQCGSAPLQTPDGNVYFVGGVYSPIIGGQVVYLARVNWANVSSTPAVRVWNSAGVDAMNLVYDSVNQLMVISDTSLGWQACVDLVQGTRLWATQSLPLNYAVVKTPQLTIPGASNVLWAGPPIGTPVWQATNVFDGTPIETFCMPPFTTGQNTWVTSVANKLILIATSYENIATYEQLLVQSVSAPTGFRSASLPVFAATSTTTLPVTHPTTPVPFPTLPVNGGDGSTTSPFVYIGVAACALAMSVGTALVFMNCIRRRRFAASSMQYAAVPVVGGVVMPSAEKAPLRTSLEAAATMVV